MKKYIVLLALLVLLSQSFAVLIKAPAVSETSTGYVGVPITIDIKVGKGSGNVYMDTLPLTQLDMQGSARIAYKVACEITGKNPNNYNVYISVRSDVPIVGGPSAGGTMTVGIVSELMNWSLNRNVMMTGMINPDGSIGPVGGILEKIEAAKKANCTIFLIPKGQRYVNYNGKIIDAVAYGKRLGVKVIEVSNIYQALKYFTGKDIEMKKYPQNPKVEEEYKKIMKNLADKILKESNEKYEEVKSEVESTLYPIGYQSIVLEKLKNAKALLNKANDEYLKGDYYSATSRAFNALIQLEYLDKLTKYLNGELELKDYLNEIETQLFKDKEKIYSKNLTYDNFEILLAARERIFEANNYLDLAWKSYYNGDFDSALYYGSFAKLRGDSAMWWLSLMNDSEGDIIDKNKVKYLAQQYLSFSETLTTYVETLFPSIDFSGAEEDIKDAKDAYENGDYLLTIAKCIDASVKAELPLVMIGNETTYIKEYARNKINLVEQYNIVPISALSYYEYANNLDDKITKALYYKYSSYYAQMDLDLIKLEKIKLPKTYEIHGNFLEVREYNNNLVNSVVTSIISVLIGFVGGYMFRKVKA
ncbi:peptidase S16 lon domain protein [Methanocaldococcus infernus ME]|uniref:Peptidase S16 lon domain protein n=1 Tax=Methanocaldococcus infernus (strain DSM 11812 / JCM 15783 / ME) TaxID=573063 RepID=D5VTB1_METIM|nr:S16 family serine protease [Methanocaldococcus infernus]ADG13814.1 peptidase S16 lon domain protein [Methanocaldococcus infernus ME]